MDQSIQAVLAALKAAGQLTGGDPRMDAAMKSTFSQAGSATTGLTFYDLEPGAKLVYPVLTPLRNEIPRVSGKGGIQAAWRAVTGVNTTNLDIGVSGGNRGAVMAISTQDYTAAYKGIGIEDNVDFEAQYAGMDFEDVRSLAGLTGLQALMLKEEAVLLGGNTSVPLGTTPTPAVVASNSGGALTTATWSVICVALTFDGYSNGSIAGGIRQSVTRNNADGSTDTFGGGSGIKSAAATGIVSGGSAGSLACTVAALRGAIGYAWFWGAAGAELLGALTTAPKVSILAVATGTQTAASLSNSVDYSTNGLLFDGLLTQALKSGSGSYWTDLAGATLTADGASGVVEIEAVLKDRWDNYKLSPDTIWVSSQQAQDVGKKILAGNANGALRFTVDLSRGAVGGGIIATSYLNKFGLNGAGKEIQIKIHPNLPSGTMLFTTKVLPYPLSNVNNVFQVRTRQEYYQIEWPLRSRKWEYGVYADEVLQHYFPPSMAVITGIGAG